MILCLTGTHYSYHFFFCSFSTLYPVSSLPNFTFVISHCNHCLELPSGLFFLPSLICSLVKPQPWLHLSAHLCVYTWWEKNSTGKLTNPTWNSSSLSWKWAHDIACQSHRTYFTIIFFIPLWHNCLIYPEISNTFSIFVTLNW